MSVVPSDSASRVGESDSAVGGAGLCISPPSDVFMTTMGDAAAKYMDKYFAAYQSYCRTTQMLSNGAGSVVATSMSSAGDVSVGGSECSSRSSGSGVCSSSSATRSVASSVGVGLSSRMSRRGIRNFTRQMRSKGVTSALPGGYCYVRAMRSEAREQAALALGAYPALGDLLARPREEFMPLSSTQHLSLKLDGTVAHVGYCESSSDPSYNKAVVEFAKRTEYEFGTYGSDLRRAHSLSYLSGDFSELKLTTPIGGPDPGPKADLASNEKFIDTLTGVLSKYCSVKSLSRATEESLRVVWSSHAHGSWSSDRMLMLRDIGRSVIRNFSIGSVLRKRGRRSDVAVECSRMSDLNVLAGYYDFLFPRTLGYYGTVRKSLIVCDVLGSLQFSGSAGVSVKLFECLRSLGTTVPLDVVVSPSGIATSLVSLFHVPGYCYLQLFQPLVRQRIVNLLGSWPAIDQLLRCDVADFHSVESMSYFSVGVGAERCHLTLSGDGTSLFDVMASLSKASVYGPGTLGAAFSRVDGAPANPLCSSAMRVGGRDSHVGRLSMHHADLLARATGVSASGVVTPVVQVRQLNLYGYRVAVVYGSGVALAFALDFGDRSVKAFMPVPYVPDESKVFSYVKASADSGTRDATWYTFDGLDGRVVPYPTSSSVDAFDCLLWNAQKFVYSDGPWGRTVNMPYASFLRYHGL